jgi:hypothetical protein
MTVTDTVRDALHSAMAAHGLLFTGSGGLTNGSTILPRALALCFPEFDLAGQDIAIVFENEEERARIEQALFFGWVTADVVGGAESDDRSHLLCSLLNLGVGMIDSLCDSDSGRGALLLKFLELLDVESAASGPWQNGRMLSSLPSAVAADPTMAFAARVVDAFFSLLHAIHPPAVRKEVGRLLAAAFLAERRSVARVSATRGELLEASRNTSVLPFQIIATLVGGNIDAATHLGEAMWRIDDLVDIELDAASGALNSLLLDGPPERARIEAAARDAADHLRAGLGAADGRDFLSFVWHYAHLSPDGSTLR